MYLSSLNIRIIDGNSSEVLATARFNAAMKTFPHSQTVVANLFTQLDQQNPSLPRLLMLCAGSLFMPSCHFRLFRATRQ